MISSDPSKINRDYDLLAPEFRRLLQKSVAECNAVGYPIALFEGYRNPQRQDWLYAQGRTRDGKIVTKARGWESWHQLAVAGDIAIFENNKWSWDFDPGKIVHFFTDQGLESLAPLEQCHFQWTGKVPIKEARDIAVNHGVQSLWLEIKARSK